MKFRKLTAAIAAATLIATPTLAAGVNAAPTSAPASETVGANGEQQLYGSSLLLQVGLLVVAAAAIYFLVDALKGKDKPASP
jgi:hypothetical protein